MKRLIPATLALLVVACDAMEPNQPPEALEPVPDQELFVGDTFQVELKKHFQDEDELNYDATSLFDVVAVSVNGSILTGSPAKKGTDEISVTATDPDGESAKSSFAVEVGNRKPTSSPIPVIEVLPEEEFTLDLVEYFTDPDGDSLDYKVRVDPGIDAEFRIEGSILTGEAGRTRGSKTVFITASDGDAEVDEALRVEVLNSGPVMKRPLPDREAFPDERVLIFLNNYFEDPNGDALRYEATLSNDLVRRLLSGDRLTLDTQRERGTVTVTVTAIDPAGARLTDEFDLTVTNRGPKIVDGPPLYVRPGSRMTIVPISHIADPDGDTLTYTGTSSNSNLVEVVSEGESLTLEISESANAPVTVAISGSDEASTVETTITVTPYEPTEILREDFDSESSLDNWTPRHLRGRVVDGKLELDWQEEVQTDPKYNHIPGHMYRELKTSGNWEVRFKMGWKEGDEPSGVFLVYTPSQRWPIWELDLDYGFGGWSVFISRGGTSRWTLLEGDTRPNFVKDEMLRDYTWLLIDGVMMFAEGERLLYWEKVANDWPNESSSPVGMTGIGVGTYFPFEEVDGVRADEIEVNSVGSYTSQHKEN